MIKNQTEHNASFWVGSSIIVVMAVPAGVARVQMHLTKYKLEKRQLDKEVG